MAIGFGVACPKPQPKVVDTILKRRKAVSLDRAAKELVRQRDKEACRVCFRRSREVHERIYKSRGGAASLENSLVLCKTCHALVHGRALKPLGPTCNGHLYFAMSQATSWLVFGSKPLPRHITLTP
jgi:hypothetical protein